MISIIRERDSGKAYDLLEAANKTRGIVVTENREALQVKANAYGFYSVTIINYNDLLEGNYYFGEPIFIHNADKFMKFIMLNKFGLDMQGYSATLEE